MKFAGKWKELENIILSEVTQTQKDKHEEWIRKMWFIYTMEYYAAEKNNDFMKFAGKWMELENVILSKGQHTEAVFQKSYFLFTTKLEHDLHALHDSMSHLRKVTLLASGFSMPGSNCRSYYSIMGMSSLKLLKYVLFIFNLLFWVCGCCILGFGIYLLVQNTYGVLFRNLPFLTLGNVLVIVGSIIMVVAFLGCMGSIKENKCLLMS
ncbi:hypothetical protein STEG23_010565, partial [Scotinomys teguina]